MDLPLKEIELAAKRIVFGKFLNCGQTCVAPDYVLCHASVRDRFAELLKKQINGKVDTISFQQCL